jgi:hypothetical protein
MHGQDFQGKGKGIQTAAKSPVRLPLGALNTDELNYYSAGSALVRCFPAEACWVAEGSLPIAV